MDFLTSNNATTARFKIPVFMTQSYQLLADQIIRSNDSTIVMEVYKFVASAQRTRLYSEDILRLCR
jgi:hypothetical protein